MVFLKTILIHLSLVLASTLPAASEDNVSEPYQVLENVPAVKGSPDKEIIVGNPLVITFFASWCPPCSDEFDVLNKAIDDVAQRKGEGHITFVGINLFENFGGKENPGRMMRFIEKTRPDFPLIKGDRKISKAFGGITRIPTVIVFNNQGREVWRFVHEAGSTKTLVALPELLEVINPFINPE